MRASRRIFPFVQRVFADSGYAGEKVAKATLIAVEIVRKNSDQIGFAVSPRLGHARTSTSLKGLAHQRPQGGVFLQRDHVEAAATACKRAEDSVNQFLLEGEVFGVPGLVRWYAVRPTDGALQWFDEKCAQDMFCSTTATKCYGI
jgi:hypothetical protein